MALVFLDGGSHRTSLRYGLDYARAAAADPFRKPIENIHKELKTLQPALQRLLSHARISDWGHEEHFDRPNHPTVILGGVLAPSFIMDFQRSVLEEFGIDCANIGPKINKGPWESDIEKMEADFLRLWEEGGRQKLVILTHSLGGVFGEYLRKKHPDKVEMLIIQQVPINASSQNIGTATNLELLELMMRRFVAKKMNDEIFNHTDPIAIDDGPPVVSIAAFDDGIVEYRAQILAPSNGRVTYLAKMTHVEGVARRSPVEFIVKLIEEGPFASPTNSFNRLIVPDTGNSLSLPAVS